MGAAAIATATADLFLAAASLRRADAESRFYYLAAAGLFSVGAGTAILLRRMRGYSAAICLVNVLIGAVLIALGATIDRHGSALEWSVPLIPATIVIVSGLGLLFLLWPEYRDHLFAEQDVRSGPRDDVHWRQWLLGSLWDVAVQPPPDRFLLQALTFMAINVIAVAGSVGLKGFGRPDSVTGFVLQFVLALVWILGLGAWYIRLVRRNWQAAARSAEEELLRPGSRRPIPYLRSFQLDEHTGPRLPSADEILSMRPTLTLEQELGEELRRCGPLIAIGRPNEKLPELGAARFYVREDSWHEKIADIIQVAQLVVWVTGATEGLRWELSYLIAHFPPERLVLLAHPHLLSLDADGREAEWTRFRETLGGLFPKPLPERLGDIRFIFFNANFDPVPVEAQGEAHAGRDALRALLTLKGLSKPDPVARAHRRRILLLGTACAGIVLLGGYGVFKLARRMETIVLDTERTLETMENELVANEDSGTPEEGLEKHKQFLSDEWRWRVGGATISEDLRALASDYVKIFESARQTPAVEDLLYANGRPLFVNMRRVDDADERIAALGPISTALAQFLERYQQMRARVVLPRKPLFDLPRALSSNFGERTEARVDLLKAEADILGYLQENAGMWTIESHRQHTEIKVPRFAQEELQVEFDALWQTRDDAFKRLQDALPPPEPTSANPPPMDASAPPPANPPGMDASAPPPAAPTPRPGVARKLNSGDFRPRRRSK